MATLSTLTSQYNSYAPRIKAARKAGDTASVNKLIKLQNGVDAQIKALKNTKGTAPKNTTPTQPTPNKQSSPKPTTTPKAKPTTGSTASPTPKPATPTAIAPKQPPMAPTLPKAIPTPAVPKKGVVAAGKRLAGAIGGALGAGAKALPGTAGKVARGLGSAAKFTAKVGIPAAAGAAATYALMKDGSPAKADDTKKADSTSTPTPTIAAKPKSSNKVSINKPTNSKSASNNLFGSNAKEWAANEQKTLKEDQRKNKEQIAAADKKYEDSMKRVNTRKGKNPFGDF